MRLGFKDTRARAFLHAKDSDNRLNPRSGFSSIALRFIGAGTVAPLLLLGTALQAQSRQNAPPGNGATAGLQKDYESPASGEGEWLMSTETARNSADLPNNLDISFNHSAVTEPCPAGTLCPGQVSTSIDWSPSIDSQKEPPADGDKPHEDSIPRASVIAHSPKPADFNRSIYYKNKLEFGLDVGWLPINIPFVYDVFVGDSYNMTPLKYTMVPIIASLRWQTNDIGGPWILRGNFDLTFSGSITAIPRGPETRYYSFIFGIRRNFVPRRGRIAPYFDQRGGIGNIDAKEPLGVPWAQGQNLTFTYNMGAGFRYNLNPHYSISAGVNYMHVSNAYLSEPKYTNYGINVYGPMFGLDVRLGKSHRSAAQ